MNQYCLYGSNYEKSARVFYNKLIDLNRDEELLFNDLIDQRCIKDMIISTRLEELKWKSGWNDTKIYSYIRTKRNLYKLE